MIVHRFEEQVKRYPNQIAIKTIDKELSYNALNSYANVVASELINKYENSLEGGKQNIVTLLFEHGSDMIVSTIGALKAGMIYVPLDPSYPIKRLLYMIENSKTKVIITNNKNVELALMLVTEAKASVSIFNIDNMGQCNSKKDIERKICDNDIAYILYTSGSTGNPKGVIQTHRNVIHFVNSYTNTLSITSEDKMTLFSAFSHDAAIIDIYSSLLNGATLYPLNIKEQIIINELPNWLEKEQITIYHSVPTLYRYFINSLTEKQELKKLRFIILGGENVIEHDITMFEKLFTDTRLVNLYGQTESSYNSAQIFSTNSEFKNITLGQAVEETEILVIDENREEVLPLRIGEIVIISDYVALGYWNDEEKTKEVFECTPELEKLYWTGDLGRLLEDGSIKFIGRKGSQVKIRGYRVELGEVETKLLNHEDIKEAVVLCKEDINLGENYLSAYIVSNRALTIAELREYLSMQLPEYMIPKDFIQLEHIPLTPNGKVDRKTLMETEGNNLIGEEYEAPRNDLEKKLVEIWSELLNVEKIGINDDFFSIGGHSLKATTLAANIYKEFDVEIPLTEVFKLPTIKEIAAYIERAEKSIYVGIQAVEKREYYPVSSAQRRMYILNQLNSKDINYNMPIILKVNGILDIDKVEKAMYNLVLRHESLRTSFDLIDGEIVQKIDEKPRVNIKYSNEAEEDLDKLIKGFIKPFYLNTGFLFRLEIITLNKESHVLMFDVHHIISDGTSTGILIQEFLALYSGNELSDLKIQYKDYAAWENSLFESEEMKKQENFWLDMFKKEQELLNMPLDFPRKDKQILNGDRIRFEIPMDIIAKIDNIAKEEGTTLNIVLFSAYKLLLSQYSEQNDITLGLSVAGRSHPDLNEIVGVFTNSLPIRSEININSKFDEFLQMEKDLIIKAYDNQNYPFDKIVSRVVKKQDATRNPIFDSMFILHNQYDANIKLKIDGLDIHEIEIRRNTSKLDFQMDVHVDNEGNLKGSLEYNTNLFKEETMNIFLKHFNMIINKIVENKESKLSDMAIFTDEERRVIADKRCDNNLLKQQLPVVITATFTSEPIEEYIKWWCKQFDTNIEIKFAPYNQVFQQLMDTSSLISKNLGINIVLIRFEDWIRDIKSEEEKINVLEKSFNDFIIAMKNQRKGSIFLLGIFEISTHLMLSNKILHYIEKLNIQMKKIFENMSNMHIVDFTDISKLYNVTQVFDVISDKESHMPFTDEYYATMGTTIARKICAITKTPFKVIVLDCDNTLWSGICGEDGALGIKVEESYKEFQKFLLQKSNEGILLALCSKNNESDVLEVFEKNTEMILKKENFAAWRINWKNKSNNIRELSEELNLSLDSFIFIDDSVLECSDVMMNCPEVLTLQLPLDNAIIPKFIKHVWAFDREKITKEDKNRTQMYLAEKYRKNLLEEKRSIHNFLKDLNLKMSINLITDNDVARASQLTQRTNQFNLSTRRRTEEEIIQLMNNENVRCWGVEVADRFGEYGLVGLIITEKQDSVLQIDSFLLSCRALGRGVAEAMVTCMAQYCRDENIQSMTAKFYPTNKNKPFKEFIENGKWKKVKTTNSYIEYEMNVDDISQAVEFIECYYNASYKKEIQETKKDSLVDMISNNKADFCLNSIKEENEDNDINWEVQVLNKENLMHFNQVLAINNYSGKMLLKLPISKCIDDNELIRQKYEAPRNKIEEKLVKVWFDVLNIDKIGINDDFFDIGGHSLKATSLISKIHKEFNVVISLVEIFKSPTIKEMATYIEKSENNMYSSIQIVKEKQYYEVSSAQKRMYMLQQFDLKSIAYNTPRVMIIEGELDEEKLQQVFHQLAQRHESLRTYFETVEGKIVQKISEDVNFNLEHFKVECLENEEKVVSNIIKEFIKPFNLNQAPLTRGGVIEVNPKKHILMFDMHHIISDGVSMGILINEITKLYEGNELEELKIQYKDYSEWQNNLLKSDTIEKQKKYWINKFSDEIPILNMLTDFQRPPIQSFEGENITFKINKELTENLNRLSKETGSTMYIVLLSAVNILLSKYSGQEDIIIGSPIAGRPHVDLEKIIGIFVNTLAMRNYPEGYKTYKDFLKEVKENSLTAYENQDYQFDELVDNLNITRDMSRNPLFDVMLIMQNMNVNDIELKNLVFKEYMQEHKIAKFDLTFSANEVMGEIIINLEYCTKLYKKETIERMIKHFIKILISISNNIQIKISEIEMLTEEEKNKVLYEFNDNYAEYPRDKTIHELFEEQVEKTPDNVAVVFENKKITYRELNERANSLARTLCEKGVKPDSIVAIMVERSIEMIVGIMGILKAGGAYMPIDPEYPEDRIDYMLKNSGTKMLLVQEKFRKKSKFDGIIINLENERIYENSKENLKNINISQNLSYLIYTSGSTGMPKGVMIEHKSVVNTLLWRIKYYEFNNPHTVLQIPSFSFDSSVEDIFTTLLSGSKLILIPQDNKVNLNYIKTCIEKNNVNHMLLVPSFYRAMLKEIGNSLLNMKVVTLAGENITKEIVIEHYKKLSNVRLFNEYGPTENSVCTSAYEIKKDNVCISIGKPINNSKCYILNGDNKVQPIGIPGEICIAGSGIARGYMNNLELTEEKFLNSPYGINEKMYKTGDLGRWLPDGNIEFIGRVDHQVKIRGFRIELGEIENQLLNFESINEVVVKDKEDKNGSKYLCAYLVSEKELTVGILRSYLLKKLPEYMVPSYFVQLDKMPLTPNGKIDKKVLPEPNESILTGTEYEEPKNEIEKKLIEIWRAVLGVGRIGINDNFFELGGHSLNATTLVSKIYKEFNVEVPLKVIFKIPTIKDISKCILNQDIFISYMENIENEIVIRLNDIKAESIFLFPPMLGYGVAYKELAKHIEDYTVYSFDFIENSNRMEEYINQITSIQKEGKYILMGYSAGGNLAFEVARELENRGYEVSDIILLDSLVRNEKIQDDLENKKRMKVMESVIEYAHINAPFMLDYITENVQRKFDEFTPYWNDLINSGTLNSNIYLILSSSENINEEEVKIRLDKANEWSNLTNKCLSIYQGYGEHHQMVDDYKNARLNAQIINKILIL